MCPIRVPAKLKMRWALSFSSPDGQIQIQVEAIRSHGHTRMTVGEVRQTYDTHMTPRRIQITPLTFT